MKILNLYAGIGGNRKSWGNKHHITAVEYDEKIAEIYADHFPHDEVIVGDAHQFLLEHYREFDFIWSSPPCQSHSSFRFNIGVRYRGVEPVYPDMRLYQEIIFLNNHHDGQWVVENVKPYYRPLIEPNVELQRHFFWSNFHIPEKKFEADRIRTAQIPDLQELHGYDLSKYKISEKRQILRNCVHHPVGKYILDVAMGETV
jgi:DNA (cytosine-5)-methyltransferase 1